MSSLPERGSPLVLVADDDTDIRELVAHHLESAGHEVIHAADGEQAFGLALEHQPDLAVLDVMMPRLNGLDLTRRLRSNDRTSRTPILLLTARAAGEDVARAFKAGADDYLRKPFNATELKARIEAALRRSSLTAELTEAARVDGLTGLPNRRTWDEELVRELGRSARAGTPLCLAVLDLDDFKEFNHLHGHQAGDVLLREAAAAWRATLREGDLVARYGGDEFGVLLPDCSLEGARQVLDRLIAVTPREQSCSGGLAQWHASETVDQLVHRADRALYVGKRAGRGRLVLA